MLTIRGRLSNELYFFGEWQPSFLLSSAEIINNIAIKLAMRQTTMPSKGTQQPAFGFYSTSQ